MSSTDGTQLRKFRLNSPFMQNLSMGCLLFCLPGIYLALIGLGAGGGGPNALTVALNTNAILYGVFTLSGWVGGMVLNIFRPKFTIAFGSIGYSMYVGGLWYFDRSGNNWLAYFSGFLLGVSAGCLWTGAGFIAYSYAEEKDKGKYIAIQWALTAFGGTVGASIAFGISAKQTTATGVSDAVYGTFVAIMCSATVASLLLIKDPRNIVRSDGTHLAEFEPTDVLKELGRFKELLSDWKMWALIVPLFASELCLSTASSVNAYYFSLRARGLNNVLFQFVGIVTALSLSWLLDHKRLSRRARGMLASSIITVITMGASAGMVGWMKINGLDGRLPTPPGVDWTSSSFAAGTVLYILWGIVYSGYLTCVMWVCASQSNDPVKLALWSGFSKGTASFGLCMCFVMDSRSVTYMTQVIIEFVLYGVGGLVMIFIVYCTAESHYFLEDHVIVPAHIQEAATDTKVAEMMVDVKHVPEEAHEEVR